MDTAGRLHIDDELMTELQQLKEQLNPVEILFVADAMTGQDAVKSADEFHKRLGITGVILTKMDGDARGGAALSIRHVTGQPLKFVGVGEKSDALEPFHPDRAAQRILGMGDMLSFIEKAEEAIDKKQAVEMQRKLIENEFTLEDFRDQMRQMRKLGPLESLLGMMPQVGHAQGAEERQGGRERNHPRGGDHRLDDPARARQPHDHQRQPPAAHRQGSGTSVQEVNQLLKQYAQARKMMKIFSGGMSGQEAGQNETAAWACRGVGFRDSDSSKGQLMLMIRLARFGAKKKPFYRVVVIEKERARNGRNLEVVGHYNPLTNPPQVVLKHERIEYWTKTGAQLSDTVTRLMENNPAPPAGSLIPAGFRA